MLVYNHFYSLKNSGNNAGLKLYNKEKGSFIVTTSQERGYSNQLNIDLTNVMSSMKFTCKYSIQTFLVEVYTVVADDKMITNYQSPFSSVDVMNAASNMNPDNRGQYGLPFISTESYAAGAIPTISTDCAKLQTMSFNVPFYYFLTDTQSRDGATSVHSTARSNYSSALGNKHNGLDFIYEKGGK